MLTIEFANDIKWHPTQEEVARRAGIRQPTYAKIENVKTQPSMSTCKNLAAAMGIEWEQLME